MQTKTVRITLIVIGIIMIVYAWANFIATDNIADAGAVKISGERNLPAQWSPVIRVGLLIGGIVVLIRDKKISVRNV